MYYRIGKVLFDDYLGTLNVPKCYGAVPYGHLSYVSDVESNSIASFSSHRFTGVVHPFGTSASFSCVY